MNGNTATATTTNSSIPSSDAFGPEPNSNIQRLERGALTGNLSTAGGNVTSFVETPLLKIDTNGTELTRTTVVLLPTTKPNPFGTYFLANKTATVALKQADIDSLKMALKGQPGMHIEFKYDHTINTNTSSNALTFTYGTKVVALAIVPKTV